MGVLPILVALLFLSGCSESDLPMDTGNEPVVQPIQETPPEKWSLPKELFDGEFLYLKSIVKSAPTSQESARKHFTGRYLASNKIVRLSAGLSSLDFISTVQERDEKTGMPKPRRIARFEAKQSETFQIKSIDDPFDSLRPQTTAIFPAQPPTWDPKRGHLSFQVERHLKDGTELTIQYSLLRYKKNRLFRKREYTSLLQRYLGAFKVTNFDGDKEPTHYMQRWDTHERIQFYFSSDFPEKMKPMAQTAFAHWNQAILNVRKQPLFEKIKEISDRNLGDLDVNILHFEDAPVFKTILGYAPAFSHPTSGEILKADIVLYGGALQYVQMRNAILSQREPSEALSRPVFDSEEDLHWGPQRGLGQGEEWLKDFMAQLLPHNLPAQIEKTWMSEAFERITRTSSFSPFPGFRIQALLPGLLSHEIGHVLGLRHNFAASADKDNYAADTESSSAMEYGFEANHELHGPGPYDQQVLEMLYGSNPDSIPLGEFLYCTDEHLWSNRKGYCHPFDRGHNLVAIAKSLNDRYRRNYKINNSRTGQAFFASTKKNYHKTVLNLLKPMRNQLDYVNAILDMGREVRHLDASIGADPELFYQTIQKFRSLVGRRLDADKNAEETNTRFYRGKDGGLIKIDMKKHFSIAREARLAQKALFGYLSDIILDRSRPVHDEFSLSDGKLKTIGVLTDKLTALALLTERKPSPISGAHHSVFEFLPVDFSILLRKLLTNMGDQEDVLTPYDPTLRQLALNTVEKSLSTPGEVTTQAIEIFRIDEVLDEAFDEKEKKEYDAHVEKFQHALFTWSSAHAGWSEMPEIDPTLLELQNHSKFGERLALSEMTRIRKSIIECKRKALQKAEGFDEKANARELQNLRIQKHALRYVGTPLGRREVYAAPLNIQIGSHSLETATGYLIRDSIHVTEDAIEVLKIRRDNQERGAKKESATREEKMDANQIVHMIDEQITNLSEVLHRERHFLTAMLRIYSRR